MHDATRHSIRFYASSHSPPGLWHPGQLYWQRRPRSSAEMTVVTTRLPMQRPDHSPNVHVPPPMTWTMESAPAAETVISGRRYLYFAGTGYLGLQGHPALIEAAREGAAKYGIHTATTRTTFGTSPPVARGGAASVAAAGDRRLPCTWSAGMPAILRWPPRSRAQSTWPSLTNRRTTACASPPAGSMD